ncbi:MAG: non-histone chromosomal MC1 family protein [ANME-2 cluster archaeon]|nr:non-histone chromosomal MC1 family protein [ANME-2 cluster archaeon]
MTGTRNFVLRDKKGNEHGVFTGKQPRQAALKAANRGKGTKKKPDTIILRERGTKKLHVYEGWREEVAAPKNKPSWMPDKIKKPNVKKINIEIIDKV